MTKSWLRLRGQHKGLQAQIPFVPGESTVHEVPFRMVEEVVNFYNKSGVKNSHQDNLAIPLELTEVEKYDLVIFLHTLNGEGWQRATGPT